jgi:outer membrane protein OmpA-like peptidoglycan-associated protein/ABC-type taurine transport system substrate-binding protein
MIILFLGLLSIVGIKFIAPILEDRNSTATSDAKATKGRIVIGVDNFVGYFPLCSPELFKRMRQSGYLMECQDDGADYAKRMDKLDRGKIDLAVGTVDSYVLNGASENYPGTIIAVLDESKGGDALVAWSDKIANLESLRNQQSMSIAFTPDSPSHQLLKALAVHFDIDTLKSSRKWEVESDGSEQALEKLLNKEVDAAVLWEPDVSKALSNEGVVRILGTEMTQQLIVDILIVNREFSQKKPEAVNQLLKEYFKTLKYYRNNPQSLRDAIAQSTKLSESQIEAMLKGIEWQSLSQNAEKWFGVSRTGNVSSESLIDTIDTAVDVLIDYGTVDTNPIPDRDPYRLTNSTYISTLFESLMASSGFAVKSDNKQIEFSALGEREWKRLKEIGTLKVRPIVFASGSDALTLEGKQQLDLASKNLKHYPAFRVEVRGHTGLRGDKTANVMLSQERADAVIRYLQITHEIDENRFRAIGLGGLKPLAKQPNESNRAYNYRLPRVELVLMGEDF